VNFLESKLVREEVVLKPSREKTISAKVNRYEYDLLELVSSACGVSKSTFVENAVAYALYLVMRDNTWGLSNGDVWARIIEDLGYRAKQFISQCESAVGQRGF
jgi:hypothetical protein